MRKDKVFISFQDENNKKIEGYFELIDKTINYIKIKSYDNLLTIPYHRINKIKENMKGGQ
jgi:hypothetical protein